MSNKGILFIDDDKFLRNEFQEYFVREQWIVKTASNGLEGLNIIKTEGNKYDIIVLDLLMPEMDGVALLKLLKQLKKEGIEVPPIVVLSAYLSRYPTEDFARLGTEQPMQLLKKPIRLGKLKEILSKILNPEFGVINILHLSDLHITEDTDVLTILQPLVADLKHGEWPDTGKPDNRLINCIAISGDFSNEAKEKEFDKAREFVEKLAEEVNLPLGNFILVPGNHDQSWSDENTKFYDLEDEKLADENRLEAGYYHKSDKSYAIRNEDKYPCRFSNFSTFLHKPLTGSEYPFDFVDQAIVKFFEDAGILFLTMNSSWEVDEYFPKRAHINEGALARGLKEVMNITEIHRGSSILKIALWHHPTTDDERIQNKDILEQLKEANFKLVLHGHVHKEIADLLYYTHENQVHVVGTGSFGAPVNQRPESTPRLYNLLEVSRNRRKVRVYVRRRNTKSGAWGPDFNTGSGKSYYDINL
jgi:CheY-like chemotaxis protein